MAKKLTVELLDSGAPASGVTVKVTGCGELETGVAGSTFFLVDEAQLSVTVAGREVYTSSIDALPPKLCFVKSGGDWVPA